MLVTRHVAEAVVEHLEAVEVDEQNREVVALAAAHARQRLAEAVHEERAVGQPGERIVERVVTDLVLGALAGRQIEEEPDGRRLALEGAVVAVDLERNLRAVLAPRAEGAADVAALAGNQIGRAS